MNKAERIFKHLTGLSIVALSSFTTLISLVFIRLWGELYGALATSAVALMVIILGVRYLFWADHSACHTFNERGRVVWRCCWCETGFRYDFTDEPQDVNDAKCQRCGHAWCGDFNDIAHHKVLSLEHELREANRRINTQPPYR